MSWEKIRVGDYCDITSSKRIFFSEYTEIGVPFYRSKEIIESANGQKISEPLFISQEKYEEIKSKFGVPQPGDMLLTSVGTIGVPYIVKKDDYFYFKDGNLTWFRNFNNRLNSQYLYHWINSSEGQGVLNNTTIGSSQKALTISALKSVEIPCPPIAIQKRIVEILAGYDNLIENNQKQIKLLEEAAQRLYKEWFVDLRFPGWESTPIVDGVPEGWNKEIISNFVSTSSGGTPSRARSEYYSNGTNLWVKTQELNDGFIFDSEEKITDDAIKNSAAKIVPRGSILMAMYGATIGKIGIAATNLTCNQACCIFKIFEVKHATSYLYCWLINNRKFFISQGKGAAQPNLSQAIIKNFPILIPSTKVLANFSKIIDTMLELLEKLQLQNKNLIEARNRLLPKLMSGELDVDKDI